MISVDLSPAEFGNAISGGLYLPHVLDRHGMDVHVYTAVEFPEEWRRLWFKHSTVRDMKGRRNDVDFGGKRELEEFVRKQQLPVEMFRPMPMPALPRLLDAPYVVLIPTVFGHRHNENFGPRQVLSLEWRFWKELAEVAHGHPLGLSLLADVVARGGQAAADPLTPDLVGTLLRRFVEVVPSGGHRRALEVCALARVTTEALLREALGLEDANELFAWLRELSFVESGPEGVFPHDLARDALEADLRWRDPDGYRRVLRGIRGHVNGRLRTYGQTYGY